VLLSGHFERYLYAVNEEAVEALVRAAINSTEIPIGIRLRHSKSPIDTLAATEWTRRQPALEDLMRNEANLWLGGGVPPNLTSERLLEWMKSPACDDIKRYYLQWGIPDIFGAITRSPKTRGALWRGLTSLVDKRNSIAHGDANMGATQGDVREYKAAVRTFVTRADAHLSLRLHRLFNFGRPW
jgi:hypothetical protein